MAELETEELDELIVAQLERFGRSPSYAIRNGIRLNGGPFLPVPRILRRLRALEKAGAVQMIGWRGNMYEWGLAPKGGDQ